VVADIDIAIDTNTKTAAVTDTDSFNNIERLADMYLRFKIVKLN